MFEAFLLKYPNDKRWTPDAMFRLAELYYEKSAEEYLDADEAYKKALDTPEPARHAAAAGRLHADHQPLPPPADRVPELPLPRRRLLPARLLPGRDGRGAAGQAGAAGAGLLEPLQAARYAGPDAEAGAARAGAPRRRDEEFYKECTPVRKESKFIPEAWTRIGEFHFDNPNELQFAIAAFRKVLTFKDSPYYDRALYKLAWSYYRDNRFPEAVREFDNLVKYADARTAAGQKVGSDLRPEAIQYLGVSFAEPDWDGDTLPDADQRPAARRWTSTRAARRSRTCARCSSASATSTSTRPSTPTRSPSTRRCCTKWPYYSDAPRVQDRIVHAYEKDRNLVAAAKERETLGPLVHQGQRLVPAQPGQPGGARGRAAARRGRAADRGHQRARRGAGLQEQVAGEPEGHQEAGGVQEAVRAPAPSSTRSSWPPTRTRSAATSSRRSTPTRSTTPGSSSRRSPPTRTVRDSQLDNRYQEDAAFRMIKTYEEIIDGMKKAKEIDDPPIPDEKNTKPPVIADGDARRLQEVPRGDRLVRRAHQERPHPRPQVRGGRHHAALPRLADARASAWRRSPSSTAAPSPDVGFKAYDAILQTYFIDYLVQDEEQKDCALGQLLTVAEQFGESACGKAPAAKPYLARIAQIKSSVKTTIITKRLQLSMENEEKGTQQAADDVPDRAGRHRAGHRAGGADQGRRRRRRRPRRAPSTQLDVGLALDLIDVVNANPKDPGAPTALNNACVIYEKLFQFGEATKCYERLYGSYPDSEWGKEALWNASRNHYRFFEFDQAVKGYLTVAQDPKFAQSEHRKEALGLAASMLDNDQQYARAADLYKKYSDAVADKPQDSAQAYFFACNAYEKANDIAKYSACLKDFIKKLRQAAGGGRVRRPGVHEAGRDHRARRTRTRPRCSPPTSACATSSSPRKLPPATPAAGFAAKADFLIMEEKFKAFQKKELKFGSKPDQIKKTFDSFTAEAKALQRGLPEDLGLQGRDLDAGVVPPLGRRLLRVRAEADQGRRRAARGAQEARQAGVQAEPRRLRPRRGAVQGRHLPVRDARRGRGEEALEGHAGARVADGRDQRLREEGAREPVEVPARRVPVHQGRARRTGVPVSDARRLRGLPLAAGARAAARVRRRRWRARQPPPAVIPTEETQKARDLYKVGRYPDAVPRPRRRSTRTNATRPPCW